MAKPVVNVLAVSLRAGDEHLTPIFTKLLTQQPHLALYESPRDPQWTLGSQHRSLIKVSSTPRFSISQHKLSKHLIGD